MKKNKLNNKKQYKPFIRISWEEAMEVLKSGLHYKYDAGGKIMLMKDYDYGVIDYDYNEAPGFVDIYLR